MAGRGREGEIAVKKKLTERQLFETWVITAYPETGLKRQLTTGYYWERETLANVMWAAWQASKRVKR